LTQNIGAAKFTLQLEDFSKIKGRYEPYDSVSALPMRHAGNTVIWEGNYTSDIFNIGRTWINLNFFAVLYMLI
jgi:hypothetical protein